MKWNKMLVILKGIGASKKCKCMSAKQEHMSDAAFKTWSFSYNFNFACKDGQVTAATCKYYCQLFVSPIITNCCKKHNLKCGRVPRSIFENITVHQNYSHLGWNQSFFSYYFERLPPVSKVIVFFCYFLQYDEVFLISLLNGC